MTIERLVGTSSFASYSAAVFATRPRMDAGDRLDLGHVHDARDEEDRPPHLGRASDRLVDCIERRHPADLDDPARSRELDRDDDRDADNHQHDEERQTVHLEPGPLRSDGGGGICSAGANIAKRRHAGHEDRRRSNRKSGVQSP
jgi:hypothetical protein